MNFWDTVRGHELANILINELPKLTDKEQKTVEIKKDGYYDQMVRDTMKAYLSHGYRYIDRIPLGDSDIFVFEK